MSRNFMELLRGRWSEQKFVCVGLDSEFARVAHSSVGWLEFNRRIVDATHDLVCAFKPNIAFYEAGGRHGIEVLERTIEHIHRVAPSVPVILDAKRADIGNTNLGYVTAAFEQMEADAVTVHPFLGLEAMEPFLIQAHRGIIVLCRTSNPGAGEFQDLPVMPSDRDRAMFMVHNDDMTQPVRDGRGVPLYQYVAHRVSAAWNSNSNCGVVVGATYPEQLGLVRSIVGPDMPILIPGIGAQEGDLEASVQMGRSVTGQGMIINNSRGIIFAYAKDEAYRPDEFDFAARNATMKMDNQIRAALAT